MGLSLVTGPTQEPLTLAEAKQQCRIPPDVLDEDALVQQFLVAAREHAERYTHRALLTQTWDWTLDAFPCDGPLELPLANVSSITSISYVDTAGDTQTWSSALYQTDLPAGPTAPRGRLAPAYGQFYPSTRAQMNAVTVRFVAGYGSSPSSVPAGIKTGMRLLIAHQALNRESVAVGVGIGAVVIPHSVEFWWQPFVASRTS